MSKTEKTCANDGPLMGHHVGHAMAPSHERARAHYGAMNMIPYKPKREPFKKEHTGPIWGKGGADMRPISGPSWPICESTQGAPYKTNYWVACSCSRLLE
jgi:hypothetical protein